MAGIFISYRRDDSAAQARAVWERLCRELGRDHVFMDVDGIDPGDDFTEVIDLQLDGCQVMLVMIGQQWHSVVDPHGRLRLHNRHLRKVLQQAQLRLLAHRRSLSFLPSEPQFAHSPRCHVQCLMTENLDAIALLVQ